MPFTITEASELPNMAEWKALLGWYVLVFFLAFSVVQLLRTWLRLRHIPGPPSAGFSKFWLFRNTIGGRMHLVVEETAEKYGDLIRVGPNEVLTRNPDDWRRMLGVRSRYLRSEWFQCVRIEPGIDNIVSQRDDKLHNALRAKMALGYSGKDNNHLEKTIDQHLASFIDLLVTKYLSTDTEYRPVDFSSKAQYFTLDVITDIAFGKPFGNLAADEDLYHYIEYMEQGGKVAIPMGVFPFIFKILQSRLLKSLRPSTKDATGLGKLMSIAQEIVAERFGPEGGDRKDMLGSFVRHGLTQREADQEVVLQVIAGFDTSAGVLRATMLYIVSNPHVYARLVSEIATTPISSPVTDGEARRMSYLQAVIKEGLRIHPPAVGLGFREVPAGGDTLSGYFVPGGTWVGYNFFGLMRDPKLWGEDAKVFRPERWLNASPDQLRNMDANVDLVFSWGKWQCLGKNVAMMELNKVFVELFRNFDFTIVDPQKPWKLYNASIHITSDFWMRITKREPRL